MAGLLATGLVANLLIRPPAARCFMAPEELAEVQGAQVACAGQVYGIGLGGLSPSVAAAWLCVLLPIAWGLYVTLSRVAGLL